MLGSPFDQRQEMTMTTPNQERSGPLRITIVSDFI